MKRTLLSCLTALLLLVSHSLWSQERTVTGTVTAEDASGLPGVNVVLEGSTTGTVTDVNGSYSLTVPENGTLVFTFIGLTTQEVPVVVTALNIPREKASFGFATQEVSGEAVTQAKQQNFINSMGCSDPDQLESW